MTDPQPDTPKTAEQIIDDVRNIVQTDSMLGANDFKELKPGILKKLDSYYLQLALEAVGDDEEHILPYKDRNGRTKADGTKVHRNRIRKEIREALVSAFLKGIETTDHVSIVEVDDIIHESSAFKDV